MTGNELFEEYCNEYPLIQGYREVSYESWLQHQVVEYRTQVINKNYPIHIVRVSTWDDASEGEKAPFIERAEELAQDTLFCSRVWSAWGYGTMTENDFSDTAEDDDFIDAVAKAIWEGY